MQRHAGFSLIELLIVVAIAGTLLGVGLVVIRPGRFAVNQAASNVASAVMQTRFEAIRNNRTATLTLTTDADGGSYAVCVDQDDNGACDTGEVVDTVVFGAGDYGQVALTATTITGDVVRFDRRGIPLNSIANTTITVSQRGAAYSRTVALTSTGRAAVQ